MTPRLWLLPALVAATLVTVLALELDVGGGPGEAAGGVAVRHAETPHPRAAVTETVDHTDAWVRDSLARPLFSRDRRPTPGLARGDGGARVAGLPRLTGVLVGPFSRDAIFAADGKSLVVGPGGRVGVYTVQAIKPGQVTVAGPDGIRVLQPSFDTSALAVAAQPPPPPRRHFLLGGALAHQEVSAAYPARPARQGTE